MVWVLRVGRKPIGSRSAKISLVFASMLILGCGETVAPALAQTSDRCPGFQIGRRDKPSWASLPEVTTARSNIKIAAAELAKDRNSGTASALLNAARAECGRIPNGRLNGNVQMCLGEASLAMSSPNYGEAITAFCSAAKLSGNDVNLRASAWDGIARAYAAWPNHELDALAAYNEAVNVPNPPAQRLLGLAVVQKNLDLPQADATYTRVNHPSVAAELEPPQRIQALLDQARLRTKKGRAADAELIWKEVVKTSVPAEIKSEAWLEVGRAQFARGDRKEARTSFSNSVAPDGQPVVSGHAQEGRYYIALIDAGSASTGPQWSGVVSEITKTGLATAEYKTFACLAYVASGDSKSFADVADSNLCPGPDALSPQDRLLRGVYLLRRAQFVPVSCKDERTGRDPCQDRNSDRYVVVRRERMLDEAERLFEQGGDALVNIVPSPTFDWLKEASGPAPTLSGLLRSGRAIARGANRPGCQPSLPTANEELRFFQKLDITGCTAMQTTPAR